MIVDSHCHTSDRWYEPVEVLLQQMDRVGVDRAVLTQYSGQFDNTYQTDCVTRFPDRLVSVVVVDSGRPDACDVLTALVEDGAAGLRLQATDRTPGADPLSLWRHAADLGIPVSTLGSQDAFTSPGFAAIVSELSSLTIVIEHLGTRGKTGLTFTEEDAAAVFALSRYPNVHLKFHGLAEFSPRTHDRTAAEPFARPLRPLLSMALEAFGPSRLLWGSDFPPVSAREGYAQSLELPRQAMVELGASPDEISQCFGDNALRVFRPVGPARADVAS